MMKRRMLGILIALAMSVGCLGTLSFASAEDAKVTGFNIGTIADAGSDYYVKIYFEDEVLGGDAWVTNQYQALKDKISVNGRKLSAIFASAQFGDVHWVDDGTAGTSHLRIQFMKAAGDNEYGDGVLNTASAETNEIVLESGIAAPSGVILPGLTLSLNGVGGDNVDSSMTDRYTQTGNEPEEPQGPIYAKFDVAAINNDAGNYLINLFFKSSAATGSGELINQYDALKDDVSINGKKLSEILAARPFGNVHWRAMTNKGDSQLQITLMKGSEGNPDGDGVLKEADFNTIELEQGIVAPNGSTLPKLSVKLKKDGTPVSAAENAGLVREAWQPDTAAGALTIKSLTAIEEADAGINYAFNIVFNEKVADETVINQWNNIYLADKVKINGWTLEEIFGAETPNAVDVHWFVEDDEPNGYLHVSMKTAIIEDCAIKLDGSDVVEVLPGMRSYSNLEIKTASRFVYNGTSWTGDAATVSGATLSEGTSGAKRIDVTFDRPCASDENAEDAVIDTTKITLNGAALPTGATAAYVKSGEDFALRLNLPAGALLDGANTLTIAEGFELANGYRVKENQTESVFVKVISSVTVTAPIKTRYAYGEALDLAGAKLTVTYNDESSEQIDVTNAMISDYDANTAGEQTVTVAYEGRNLTFKVTVAEQENEEPTPTGCACGAISGGTLGGGLLLLAGCGLLLLLLRRRRAEIGKTK